MARRPWTEDEIRLLGTKSDFEVGRMVGRPGKAVWAKRQALGIAAPPPLVRHWTEEEDQVVLSKPSAEAAQLLTRTKAAIAIRRRKLRCASSGEATKLLSPEEAKRRIEVPRYDSKEQEEKVKFISGPYVPPFVPIGGRLKCELRGMVQVGGYSNAIIPWPVAANHPRQLIFCGDLVKALKTESRVAVSFHFGISPQTVSGYRRDLGVERLTAGSMRLFRKTVDLARSDEARAKMSQQREGRQDLMKREDRERLREIQRRPKSEAWKLKMAEHWQRRFALLGKPGEWTEEELKLIESRPDREVARLLNRSFSAVKAKKFQLRKAKTAGSEQANSSG
jgi:hypothetical protein